MTVEDEAIELLPDPDIHDDLLNYIESARDRVAERLRQRDERNERDIREGAEVYTKSLDDRAKLRERIAALEAEKENIRVEWERLRDRELSLEAENERLRQRDETIDAAQELCRAYFEIAEKHLPAEEIRKARDSMLFQRKTEREQFRERIAALEAENERLREELNCANEQIPAQIRAALVGRKTTP